MIKNIIFDLGGVIFDIRYENVPEAFARLGVPGFAQIYAQQAQSDVIDLFEEGKMSVPEFRDYVRSLSGGVQLTDQQIDDAWNSIMGDIPVARVEMLKELRKKYRLFLFSNSNQLNCDKFRVDMLKKFGYDIFDTLFEKAYFSQDIHYRKPNADAFQFVMRDAGIDPAETLFIDDTIRHIEGAKKCGLNTHLLAKDEEIVNFVRENL
ncbi:MAG: HAD family phosphatase [Bacteroidales bacterium]|nr:HAD family phosphatase [Bacteroidales bacterium]